MDVSTLGRQTRWEAKCKAKLSVSRWCLQSMAGAPSGEHASYWRNNEHSLQLNCLMIAEVQAWAILSGGPDTLGDRIHRSQEVLVLGGKGQVRWKIDGWVPRPRWLASCG
jgi:hypothetical protein